MLFNIRILYHVIKEVHCPIEGLTDAGDVLEPLGAAVVLIDFVDGKAGCCNWKSCQYTHGYQDVEHSLNTAKKKKKIIRTIRLSVSYVHASWTVINQLYSWERYCSLLGFFWIAVKTNEPIYFDVPDFFENWERVAHFLVLSPMIINIPCWDPTHLNNWSGEQ